MYPGRKLGDRIGLGIALLLPCVAVGQEEDAATRAFSFHEDFEKPNVDPAAVSETNAEYTIHFKGVTDEKAFSGRRCYKIDITFHKGSYCFVSIPLNVPAAGNLKFSGRILVGEATTGKAGIGVGVRSSPPLLRNTNGSRSFPWFQKTGDEWKLVQADVVERAHAIFMRQIPYVTRGVQPGDLALYADRIVLYLTPRGGPKTGGRVVVYVDDLRVDGNVPREEDFRRQSKERWERVQEKTARTIASWERALEKAEERVASFGDLSKVVDTMRKEVEERLAQCSRDIAEAKRSGFIRVASYDRTGPFLRQVEHVFRNIAHLRLMERVIDDETNSTLNYRIIYVVKPIANPHQWIRPHDTLVLGRLSNEIGVRACSGEYEPASFVVRSSREIKALTASVSDLQGDHGVIPSSAVDIRVVKCWYQAGSAGFGHDQRKDQKVLVPELLLKDDSLVRVDVDKKENYLKLRFGDGEKYVWISDPTPPKSPTVHPPPDEFPVMDSRELRPVDIPARSNKQFWITVRVPEDVEAGQYRGTICLMSGRDILHKLTLTVDVLPFKLLPPYYSPSLYYDGYPDPTGKGSISGFQKTKDQYIAEMQNLIAHGVSCPVIPTRFRREANTRVYDEAQLRAVLEIRRDLGMLRRPIYLGGFLWQALDLKQPKLVTSIDLTTERKERLQRVVRQILDLARSRGATDVYFYGLDEGKGDRLTCQREAWQAIHETGGKVFVAGYTGSNFGAMGDIQDLLICAGVPSRDEAAKWHSREHKIWCYANPQGGLENAEIYRRNFGLLLWKNNYDGAATWIYQSTAGNTWNDFDSPNARDYNFVYPTVDGVIDTIQWEGYREGVDDVRYVTTLQDAICRATATQHGKEAEAVGAARHFLENLDVEASDLDAVRLELIRHIMALRRIFDSP